MRILNYGSLNIDRSYQVPHFVRPGETLASAALTECCGGKGLNQSAALAKAGLQVIHAGKVGRDGQMLIDFLNGLGVDTSRIQVDGAAATGHAIIQIDQTGQNCILLFAGANGTIDSEDIAAVLADFGQGDYLLLQNEISGISEVIDRAYEKGMFIILNPSPMDDTLLSCDLRKIGMFILNELEGAELSGATAPEEMLDALLARYPAAKIVLTLGADGAWYAERTERVFQEAYPCEVVDTTAAGDTFTGYFVRCIVEEKRPAEALRIAAKAASLTIGKKGAAPSIPAWAEVE